MITTITIILSLSSFVQQRKQREIEEEAKREEEELQRRIKEEHEQLEVGSQGTAETVSDSQYSRPVLSYLLICVAGCMDSKPSTSWS